MPKFTVTIIEKITGVEAETKEEAVEWVQELSQDEYNEYANTEEITAEEEKEV